MLNERILNSVGKCNYNMYMLITNGKEIDDILDSRNSVFELYNYRHELLDKQVIDSTKINMNNLKELLEKTFLDYLSKGSFKTIKNILINHVNGWDLNKLLEIHKQHKYHRIFSLLTINYEDWLTI